MMETIKIKEGSFWFWFAELGDSDIIYKSQRDQLDICGFRKKVCFGIFKALILITLLGVIEFGLGSIVYPVFIAYGFGVGLSFLCAALTAPLLISMVLPVIGGIVFIIEWNTMRKINKRYLDKEPTTFGKMYNSWKEKYCVPVEILEKNDGKN